METEVETAPKLLTYEQAKVFIRSHEKKLNKVFRGLKAKEHISYHLYEAKPEVGRFTYEEVKNKVICGRVVVALNPKGEAAIVSSYATTRKQLHPDLNIGTRVQVKETEKRWSTR